MFLSYSPASEPHSAAPSIVNGVAGLGPLRPALADRVAGWALPKPEQRQGCCGVAVPGLEARMPASFALSGSAEARIEPP